MRHVKPLLSSSGGSTPSAPTNLTKNGEVAQLVEQVLCKDKVAGSSPVFSTK